MSKIGNVIGGIKSNPSNWIVSKIEKENNKVIEVEFKPTFHAIAKGCLINVIEL